MTAVLAAACPALAGWPNTLPAQPLVQAPRICAPGVVALNRRCRVVDFAKLGESPDGRGWYYAFYATHWADRHGRMDRGFPVLYYLQKPTTLRLGLWVNDEPGLAGRWATTAPPRPVLIPRPEAAYVGFTLHAVRDPDDQRLFRQNKTHWKEVDVLHRSQADQDRIDKALPRGCEAAGDGVYDWPSFRLSIPARETLTHAPCGFLTAELAVEKMKVTLVSVTYSRIEPRDRPLPAPPGAPAPLTPGPASHTSPSR